jgi:8-oxo-dGTP pyrophosphatase MutT (NUDIX family)
MNNERNENENIKYSGMEDSSVSLEPSPVLTTAWPLLQERFESLKNADGVFPLLTQAQEERFKNMAAKSHTDDHEKKKETSHDNTGVATSNIHKEQNKSGGTTTTAAHREDRPQREAAVLMILCSVNGQPGVLYTKRADHMFLHAGEISFPGGHFDDSATGNSASLPDQNLLDTALRETHEELLQPLPPLEQQQQRHQLSSSLLQPPNLTVLGQTSRIPSLKGTPVTPFLAVLWPNLTVAVPSSDEDDHVTIDGIVPCSLQDYFPGDPGEVAAVFFVSVTDLVRAETTHVLPLNRFGVTEGPCFPVQGQGNLWGLTAYITQPVLHQLLRPVFIDSPIPNAKSNS